ncbi:MAG: efflux RND transporter periplasmic adaptor subunit [Planctomycetota bacterium]|jgi:HlyD family secretion protein
MKNFVIIILVAAVMVTGLMAIQSRWRVPLSNLQGTQEKVIRGDLTLPINATGEVRPARRVELKSEASGEVIEIARKPGDKVSTGDLIIRLEKTEEQRNVDKSKLDVKSAKARLAEAQIRQQLAAGADLDNAKAALQMAKESAKLSKFRMEKLAKLKDNQTNDEEKLQRHVAYQRDLSNVSQAEAGLEKAEAAIPLAEQSVAQAEASLERVQTILKDAEERLEETDIVAPLSGIVGDIRVEIGDVIQGGKTNFTGGTVLGSVLDMGTLRVGAEVDESDIEAVRQLAPAWAIPGRDEADKLPDDIYSTASSMERLPVINVESFQNEDFTGVIELINPEPRTVSGVVTYLVEVLIVSDNRKLLLPGMRADVRFTSQHVEDVLLCPNEAIREGRNNELGVFVPKEGADPQNPEYDFVPCEFGISNGRYSELECEALAEGAMVYTKLPVRRDDKS